MNKIDIKSALIGAALAVAVTLSIGAISADQGACEYKVVTGKASFQGGLEKAINDCAADGWIFVAVSPSTENPGWGFAVMRRGKK